MHFSHSTLFIITQAVTVLASPTYRCGGAPCAAGDFILAMRNSDPFQSLATDEQWKRYEQYGTTPNIKRSAAPDPQTSHDDGQQHIDGAQSRSIHITNTPHSPPAPSNHFDPQHRRGGAFLSTTEPQTAFFPDLHATDLRTDVGVAVVGTSRTTGKQRCHLAQLQAGARDAGAVWTSFLREVRVRELRDVAVVVRMPDLGADLPVRAQDAPLDWSEGDAALAAMVRSEVQILVRANLGVAPRVVASPMGAVYRRKEGSGTMAILGRGGDGARVFVDGKAVA